MFAAKAIASKATTMWPKTPQTLSQFARKFSIHKKKPSPSFACNILFGNPACRPPRDLKRERLVKKLERQYKQLDAERYFSQQEQLQMITSVSVLVSQISIIIMIHNMRSNYHDIDLWED